MKPDNLSAHSALEYDVKVRQTIPFYDFMQREVLRLVRAAKPHVTCWVDTGCGTGSLAEMGSAAFPQVSFILADPAEAMLAQARMRFTASRSGRISILPPTDSAGLTKQLPRASAQVITAIQCHHYLGPDGRRQAVQACFDILTEDGLFVAFENIAPNTRDGVRIGLARWKEFLITEGWSPAEADGHLARFGTKFYPITVEEQISVLTHAGFRVAELFWFSAMQAGFYAIK